MAKQNRDYQCVSPERVAQLLSLGVGYEGYIQFPSGHKILVEVLPGDNLIINERYTPQDTILSVQVINPANPLFMETEKHWSVQTLKGAQTVNGAVGLTTGVFEHFGPEGTMRFTKGGKISPKYYKNGWKGGTPANIKTYKVSTVASKVGRGSFFFSIPVDVSLAIMKEQSPIKAIANITFSAIGTFGGPAGVIIYGLYFGLDLLGAFDERPYIAQPPKDPLGQHTHPADATRVERVRPIEPIPQQKPQYTPQEQPVFRQGGKK